MPYYRHLVAAEDEPLNVLEVERGLVRRRRTAIGLRRFRPRSIV
jgi:uncharacterized membrane protein YdbT with pleckstrin-like domain